MKYVEQLVPKYNRRCGLELIRLDKTLGNLIVVLSDEEVIMIIISIMWMLIIFILA